MALISATQTGARLRVRLTPRAAADAVDGVATDSAGEPYLAARVRAVPEDGRANAALEALLAARAGAPRSAVRVAKGQAGRLKLVDFTGIAAAELEQRLAVAPIVRKSAP